MTMNAESRNVARWSGLPGLLTRGGGVRPASLLVVAVLTLLGAPAQTALAEQVDYSKFDHMTTGFPLDGQHLNLRCEQCHLNGIFEGTPRQCSQCHIQGNPRSAVFMPTNHIPTPQPCDSCHTTNTFQGTHFAHSNVMPGTCAQCHNNINAVGKGPNHVVTSAPCDQCHTTVSFAGGFAAFPPGHIPTTQACALCHAAGYSMQLTQMVHAGISGGCTTCHAADAPATAPITFTMQAVQTWPAPPLTVQLTPTSQNYHLPATSTLSHFTINESCDVCHATPVTPMAPTAQAAGFAAGKMTHTGITGGCANCHADGQGPFVGVTGLVLESTKGSHMPINGTGCENCHKSTTTPGGFAGTTMVHTGLNGLSNCASCHENNAADLAYFGLVGKLVLRPVTSGTATPVVAVDPNHPSTGDCSQCHASTTSFIANIATPSNHIPVGAAACTNCHTGTGAPYAPANTVMNHTGFTASCNGCHAAGKSFYGTAQTEAGGQPMQPPNIGAAGGHVPIGSADCVGCHSASSNLAGGFKFTATQTLAVSGLAPGHAAVSSQTCSSCHSAGTGGDVTWLGTIAKGPPGAVGATGASNHIAMGSGDCKTCHGSTFAVGAFKIGTTPVLGAAGHAAVSSQTCDSCHATTNTMWFGATTVTSAANHITTNAGSVCSGCHASNFVTGGFKISTSPVMSAASHSYVSTTCNSCHENNSTDLNFQGVANNIFVRPGAAPVGLSPADAAHAVAPLASPNDCTNCHNTTPPFNGNNLPNNHVPLPSAQPACTVCHAAGQPKNPSTSKMVHSSVASEACSACHGPGKGPFSGTSQGIGGQPKQQPGTVGTPGAGNHIPVSSAECNACHATADAMTGTGFHISTTPALSAAGHTAVSSLTCQTCHNSGMAWFGVTIVVPPGTVGTTGAANHIALGTGGCNTCHASNFTTGGFKITSAPSLSAAGHAAVSGQSCDSCHAAASKTWYGVTTVAPASNHIPTASAVCSACHASNFITGGFKIASSPVLSVAGHAAVSSLACGPSCHDNTSTHLSFQGVATNIYVRPGALAVGLSPVDVAHAVATLLTSDCSACHTTTPPFQGSASSEPSNHIPSSKACANCHTGYTPATTKMNHADSGVGTAGTPTACATCHGYGVGPFFGTAQGQAGGQPLQPPGPVGTTGQHVPFNNVACNMCHTSTTVPGGFKGTTVPHTNGPFMTWTRGKGTPNSGNSTPKCNLCHAPAGQKWFGTSQGTKTEGSHENSTPASDCIDCHSPTGGFAAAAAAAAKAKPRPTTGVPVRPTGRPSALGPTNPRATAGTNPLPLPSPGSGPFSHAGVLPGSCASCHRPGGSATAKPSNHLPTTLLCDACHRTTAWKPATFLHAGVGPGHCADCHAASGTGATRKPAAHFVTARSCDVCHHSTSTWLPVMYDHLSPRYRPQTGIVRCIDCHTTNTEMVVRGPVKPARRALPGGAVRP